MIYSSTLNCQHSNTSGWTALYDGAININGDIHGGEG